MSKENLDYLEKFFKYDQIDSLIRIKNKIDVLGEDGYLDYVFQKGQDIYGFTIDFDEHLELLKDMIYVVQRFQQIDEDYSAIKVAGWIGHFVCNLSYSVLKDNFDRNHLLNLYFLLNDALEDREELESCFDFKIFEADLYHHVGEITYGQKHLIDCLKPKNFKTNYLPWSLFENHENYIKFCDDDIVSKSSYFCKVFSNTGSFNETHQGKMHFYHLFTWISIIWDEDIDFNILENEIKHSLSIPISEFQNKDLRKEWEDCDLIKAKTNFKDYLISEFKLLMENIENGDQIYNFLKKIEF